MDFTKVQRELLNSSNVAEEQVTVNQRHLIDKILARYSSEFTIFRELLQNSNDAGASKVKVHFHTNKEKSIVPGGWLPWRSTITTCHTISYMNDGVPFSESDFQRLRKIADGNPDETKIGFFGVGFYSLFSICENPLVTSGNSSMGFFWKNDMLYTKRGELSADQASEWTSFFLPTRDPVPLPGRDEFAKFISTSLAFASHLQNVEVFVDDARVSLFERKASALPKQISETSGFSTQTAQKMFSLQSLGVFKVQLDVQVVSESGVAKNYSVFLKLATAEINVDLPKKLMAELIRTTKKPAPKKLHIHILFSNFEEYDSTVQNTKGSNEIFANLIPSPEKQGLVFIGFPTHQTTGCAISFAAHNLIPTVERESIDFADKSLAAYNQELLLMIGAVSRICFENEMNEINKVLLQMELDDTSKMWFYRKVAFNLNLFHFGLSTPSNVVGGVVHHSFKACTNMPFRMLSSKGKLIPVPELRLNPSDAMAPFIKATSTIPIEIIDLCPNVIKQFQSEGLILPISLQDVLVDITNTPLNETELIAFIKWWITQVRARKVTTAHLDLLKCILKYNSKDGKSVSMSQITCFTMQRFGPLDLPMPVSCLPLEISLHFSNQQQDLKDCFWNWTALKSVDWALFVSDEKEFGKDESYTNNAMSSISRLYGNLPHSEKSMLVEKLKKKTCITTQQGVKMPGDCYFSNVVLFDDLPKVSHQKLYSTEFLRDLGVREIVDLQLVFDRISSLNWDQNHLVKYLASIQDKFKSHEIKALKESMIFLKEGDGQQRFFASSLFLPVEKFRSLGFPLLAWTGKWKFTSQEASLMLTLGLNNVAGVGKIIEMIAAAPENSQRILLFKYFASEAEFEKTYSAASVKIPFIPIAGSSQLALPRECFTNEKLATMGFNVIDPIFRGFSLKLGIQDTPPGYTFVSHLQSNPPKSVENADQIFLFLASQLHKFSQRNWEQLNRIAFIPVLNSISQKVDYLEPSKCYLKAEHPIAHFVYITFSSGAEHFLKACGVRQEPSAKELAERMASNPELFITSGFDEYLILLRQVAGKYHELKTNSALIESLRTSKWLLSLRSQEKFEGKGKLFSLSCAKEIFLVDDLTLAQIFRPMTAPIEQPLEEMYLDLGSTWLSHSITQKYSASGEGEVTGLSRMIESTIRDRAPLLIYDGHQIRKASSMAPNPLELLARISVRQTASIERILTFQNNSKTQETTSCISQKSPLTIFITHSFDYFDLASSLAKLFLKTPRLNDSLLLSTFISSTLENLTRKGFPVERILSIKQNEREKQNQIKIIGRDDSSLTEKESKVKSSDNIAEQSSIKKPTSAPTDILSDFVKRVQKQFNPAPEFSDKNQLEQSIKATKPTPENRVIGETNIEEPLPTRLPRNCKVKHDLQFVQQLSKSIKLFASSSSLHVAPFDSPALGEFAFLIELIATQIYGIAAPVNIYWDEEKTDPVIAFNRDKQLFFNFRFYILWHVNFRKSLYFWFLVFAHELAHNRYSNHDELHEQEMAAFIEAYMEQCFEIRQNYS